jgi:hypothetical protein
MVAAPYPKEWARCRNHDHRGSLRSGAGYVVELVFGGLGLIPSPARAKIPDQGVSWDYTTWLNIVFGVLAAALIVRSPPAPAGSLCCA